MRDNRKSTDPGLSAAERKAQRSREAQEAIADLEKAQRAFNENRERLRKERLRREEAAGPMLSILGSQFPPLGAGGPKGDPENNAPQPHNFRKIPAATLSAEMEP